jgi:hypothetical protein
MKDRDLFIGLLLVTWMFYVVGVHAYARRKQLGQALVVLSHAAPSLAAISMAYIFLFEQGATVAQLVAGNERGTDLFMLWVVLWPLLLLATLVSGVAQCILTNVVPVVWMPVTIWGTIMCAASFVIAGCNFPDA